MRYVQALLSTIFSVSFLEKPEISVGCRRWWFKTKTEGEVCPFLGGFGQGKIGWMVPDMVLRVL